MRNRGAKWQQISMLVGECREHWDVKTKKDKGDSIRKPGRDSLKLTYAESWTTAMPWQHHLLHLDVRSGSFGEGSGTNRSRR